jgi:hypothetical protein
MISVLSHFRVFNDAHQLDTSVVDGMREVCPEKWIRR